VGIRWVEAGDGVGMLGRVGWVDGIREEGVRRSGFGREAKDALSSVGLRLRLLLLVRPRKVFVRLLRSLCGEHGQATRVRDLHFSGDWSGLSSQSSDGDVKSFQKLLRLLAWGLKILGCGFSCSKSTVLS
jgi:hypothetical protein